MAAAEDEESAFEAYVASLPRTEHGGYRVEGDIKVSDLKTVRAMYLREQAARRVLEGEDEPDSEIGRVDQALSIGSIWSDAAQANVDVKIPQDKLLNIRYCVSNGFTNHAGVNRKAQVVAAMQTATDQWENATRINGGPATINFIYDSLRDGACNETTEFGGAYYIDVRPVTGVNYDAEAGFPNHSRADRSLRISPLAYDPAGPQTFLGVVRHELGHSLGFMHEHLRPAPWCGSGDSLRTITPYDASSVMHYGGVTDASAFPCGDDGSREYNLTNYDISGVRCTYNAGADACKGIQISGAVSQYAADNNGWVYRLTSNGAQIDRYRPSSTWAAPTWGWIANQGLAGTTEILAGGNARFYRVAGGTLYRWTGSNAWSNLGTSGSARVIAHVSGNIFRLLSDGRIERATTGAFSNILNVAAAGRSIFAGSHEVFRRDSDGTIHLYNASTNTWSQVGSGFVKIAQDRSGNMFALTAVGGSMRVYTSSWVTYATGINNIFGGLSGYFASTSAAPTTVQRWSPTAQALVPYALNATTIIGGGPRRLVRHNGAGGTVNNEIRDYVYPSN